MAPPDLLLDAMLGKLARYLRMCGYDAAYALDRGVEADNQLRTIARREDRLLLTRDQTLATETAQSLLLESKDITEQLRELAEAGFDLTLADSPSHCGRCNGPLARLDPDEQTPADVPDPATEGVWRCQSCGQHFWKGSHWADVAATLAAL
ncbi:Mut7-C RNAse domain-containing protein [Halorhabdus salina]|uniref:Mut7-C RNAse domain-containing protein n=1 Tax=Halorhabdus salina TaxID=2750670 RepID=UPI0015EE50E0|nr:Mut7-C RNAse domain-containing protein [Halorhabdus salina]